MKKDRRALLVLCFIYILSFFVNPIFAAPAAENTAGMGQGAETCVTDGCHSLDGMVPVMGTQQLIPNMEAAVLFDVDTETLMYAFNADVPMPPASLVKIMTALIAVEKGKLSDIVEVKQSVISKVPDDAVSLDLLDGEKITLENLLYGMMEAAHGRGADKMTLEVRETNAPAQNLYYSFDFEKQGYRRRYYDDTGEGALLLWNNDLGATVTKNADLKDRFILQ